MGWYVNTLVTFDAEKEKAIAAAKEALDEVGEGNDVLYWDARHILTLIAEGVGWSPGPKGELFAVAYTGNYTRGERLVEGLIAFARKVFVPFGRHPCMEKLTVITQDEQTTVSKVFTIDPLQDFKVTTAELKSVWHDD